jgi:hypothetical protein
MVPVVSGYYGAPVVSPPPIVSRPIYAYAPGYWGGYGHGWRGYGHGMAGGTKHFRKKERVRAEGNHNRAPRTKHNRQALASNCGSLRQWGRFLFA